MKVAAQTGQTPFTELEQLLRSNEVGLRSASVQRYMEALPEHSMKTKVPYLSMVQAGTEYVQRLAVIAAALYPSETTLRLEYEWTASGPLVRSGIGLEQQLTLLNAYWISAREILSQSPSVLQALESVEATMTRVLHEVFSSSVWNANELSLPIQ